MSCYDSTSSVTEQRGDIEKIQTFNENKFTMTYRDLSNKVTFIDRWNDGSLDEVEIEDAPTGKKKLSRNDPLYNPEFWSRYQKLFDSLKAEYEKLEIKK